MANEIQTLTFDHVPDRNGIVLSFGADSTPSLSPATDTASTIQTAMEALASIGSGNITVTGDWTSGFTFTFVGALANTNVAQITFSSVTLAAADNTISVTTTTPASNNAEPGLTITRSTVGGTGATSSTFSLTATDSGGGLPWGGTWTLSDNTGVIWSGSGSDFPTPAGWAADNVLINGINFSSIANGPVPELTWDTSGLTDAGGGAITVSDNGSYVAGSVGAAEVDTISVNYPATGGQFNIGSTVVNFNALVSDIQDAVDTLLGVGSGDPAGAVVTGGTLDAGTSFQITFNSGGVPATIFSSANVGNSTNTMTGGPVYQVDTIALDSLVTAGTFHIGSTSGISYNDNGASVQPAIESLLSISGGTIGNPSQGIWTYQYPATGDQTADTSEIAANTAGDSLAQVVTPTITTVQQGGSSFNPAWAANVNQLIGAF